MKLTTLLLLFSSAFAVKIQQPDMAEDFDLESAELAETAAWADVQMP